MEKKKKCILIITLTLFFCSIAAIGVVWKFNKYSLSLNITEQVTTLEYGVDQMPEVSALCKGTLLNRKGTPVPTSMKGNVDLTKLGEYEVSFTAKYKKEKLHLTMKQ